MVVMNIRKNNINVIIQKMFQVSEMVPLAIQKEEKDKSGNTFKVLFKMNEHITNTDIFFEIRLICTDELDRSYIKSRSIYIDNLKKNEEKYKAFKTIMKDFSIDSFYVGDFNFEFDNGNYYIDGLKQLMDVKTGSSFFETIRLYIPRFLYIVINLYIQDLLDPYDRSEKEFLFVSPEIANMKFDKVEGVKNLGTCKTKVENTDYFSYNTMYEFNNGPTSWKFTYEVLTEEDLELINPINKEKFEAWYSNYKNNFIGFVPDSSHPGIYYVITLTENKKVMGLYCLGQFIEKTNLIDPYKIFIDDLVEEIPEEDENNNELDLENMSEAISDGWIDDKEEQ